MKRSILKVSWQIAFALLLIVTYGYLTVTLAQNTQNFEEVDANERQRIATERADRFRSNTQERKLCYQRFAVNDCLERERARHDASMDDLRRQEISLNDAQRKARGAAQSQKLDEKLSASRQADQALRREDAMRQTQEHQKQSDEKLLEKQQRLREIQENPPAQRVAKTPQALPSKATPTAKPKTDTASSRANALANQKAYQERQLAAQRRKNDAAKRMAEKPKPLPASLPMPTETQK